VTGLKKKKKKKEVRQVEEDKKIGVATICATAHNKYRKQYRHGRPGAVGLLVPVCFSLMTPTPLHTAYPFTS
jgi:hypothetical protein